MNTVSKWIYTLRIQLILSDFSHNEGYRQLVKHTNRGVTD